MSTVYQALCWGFTEHHLGKSGVGEDYCGTCGRVLGPPPSSEEAIAGLRAVTTYFRLWCERYDAAVRGKDGTSKERHQSPVEKGESHAAEGDETSGHAAATGRSEADG